MLRRWAAAHPLPDRSLELLAWQCLVGAWPISADRLAGYLGKAAKEAKLVTSHVDAVPEVDEAIAGWPERVLADAELVADIERFVERIAGPGWTNSLGQKLLQLAGPGVPDVYQGTELFEYSLVDPDNRRPVDWAVAARDCWPAWTTAGCPTSTPRARPSCWSRRARCGCAGTGRRCSAATDRCPRPARRPTTSSPSSARPHWSRWPPGCRWGWPRPVAGGTPCCRCRTAATDWWDVITGAPVEQVRTTAWLTCSIATRWRCWSARRDQANKSDIRCFHIKDSFTEVRSVSNCTPQNVRLGRAGAVTPSLGSNSPERGMSDQRRSECMAAPMTERAIARIRQLIMDGTAHRGQPATARARAGRARRVLPQHHAGSGPGPGHRASAGRPTRRRHVRHQPAARTAAGRHRDGRRPDAGREPPGAVRGTPRAGAGGQRAGRTAHRRGRA